MIIKIKIKWNKSKKSKSSQRLLTGSWNDACPKKEPYLRKREISSYFSLHRSPERKLFHVAAGREIWLIGFNSLTPCLLLASRHHWNQEYKNTDFWVGQVLWHINLCRLFNAKSIFMQIVLFQTIHFRISTQFNCQKHFYFKLFRLFKQF